MKVEENVNLEKENFIEEKTRLYGEQKIFDKNWLPIMYMFVIGILLIIFSIILVYLGQKTMSEIVMCIFTVWLLITAVIFLQKAAEFSKNAKTKATNDKSIYDIFKEDFLKKYPKKSLTKREQLKDLRHDFLTIMDYEHSAAERFPYCYGESESETEITKVDISSDKDAYLLKDEYMTITRKGYRRKIVRIALLFKINIDERLCIKTKIRDFQSQKENFAKSFWDRKDFILEYDLKNFKEAEENLTEEFYHANFGGSQNEKVFELDDRLKQKLLDIYNKYNILFSISLKNNLFKFEFERGVNRFDNGNYGYIYDMEKTIDEVIKIFLELDREKNNIKYSDVDFSNVKNLIFDLDNTIILDTEEDSEYYREALINAGFSDDYFYGIFQAIDEYDKILTEEDPCYNENKLLEFINEYLGQNFNMDVIKELKAVTGREWTKRVIIPEEIMEYLSEKYNLYVYTNYFQDVQEERIKNIGYSKYFKKIFGADKYGCKQFKNSYEKVLKEINAKPEDCVMIGDDKSRDIIAANNVNMKSILYDYNGKRDKKEITAKDYFVIKNMTELKKIL